jgi:hypothetical protein
VVLVHGDDNLAITTGSKPFPIPGRHSHTPLGVQRDFGSPSKHCGKDKPGTALLARYPGRMSLSSHFFPLFNTIGLAPWSVNRRFQLTLVVQGLKVDLMAQFGRNVAAFALAKTVTYECFLDED